MEPIVTNERERPRAIERLSWRPTLAIAVVLAAAGILALIAAGFTSVITIYVLAVALIIAGVTEIVGAFRHIKNREGSFVLRLLAGVLPLVVGAMFLWHPGIGLAAIGLLLAGYLFVSGLFRGIVAVANRYPHWGWDLLYGFVSVILGLVLMASWPLSSFLLLGALVGIELLARSASMAGLAFGMRSFTRTRREGTTVG